jgi:acylpyruvate hydrolase
MRVIAFNKKGQIHYGMIEGQTGIDLTQAYKLYSKENHLKSAEFNPDSTIEWIFPRTNYEETKQVLDWTKTQLSNRENEFRKQGITFKLDEAEILPPVFAPEKIICVGGNYPSPRKTAKPDYPTIFLKPNNTITACSKPIVLPQNSIQANIEVELVVVIGKKGRFVKSSEALKYIAGFTIANDVGDRILEKRTSQWSSGKLFDTFTPLGPSIISPDEFRLGKPHEMIARINGEILLKGNSTEMFFDVVSLISYISELTTLEPGDIILSGSPKMVDGIPSVERPLSKGDLIEAFVEGIGTLTNPVINESNQI